MSSWTIADRVRSVAAQVRRNGPRALWWEVKARISPAARAAQRRIADDGHRFDADCGYRTVQIVALEGLEIVGNREGAQHYQPVPVAELRAALAAVDIPVETATFVDLGSGMGRAVLLAAEQPFRRIIGVEFARELHEIAMANMRHKEGESGPDPRIELVHGDAAALPVPDGPVIYFLYNSFGPPTLTHVLTKVHNSWAGEPRPIRLICYNVPYRADIETAGFRWRGIAAVPAGAIYEPV